MALYNWPAQAAPYLPSSLDWWLDTNESFSTSPLNGSVQSVALPGSRWRVRMTFPPQAKADRARLRGLLGALNGREHRMAMWDHANPQRGGTCNLTGVTASAAAQFATTLTLNGLGANTTLLAGSRLSVAIAGNSGIQLVEVPFDVTANGSGVATVEIRPGLRGAVSAGAAVVLDKPTARFILTDPEIHWQQDVGGICPAVSVEWMEVFV